MQDFFQKDEKLFLKVFDEFMNAPWRVEESPLTRLEVRQSEQSGVFQNGWKGFIGYVFVSLYTWKFAFQPFTLFTLPIIVVYISVLSYRITYTSATEDQTFENQHVPVADALKPICHICHGAVVDECCPLQMICHHSPLIHRMICFRCSVAVIDANVLL